MSSAWVWDDVHDASNDDAVVTYTLAAGQHTIDVAYREDGAQLDRILVTNDLSLNPETNMMRARMASLEPEQEASSGETSGVIASPNPASGKVTIYYKVNEDGRVKVVLYNAVHHLSMLIADEYLPAGTHSTTFDTSLLPVGIHIIRVMEKGSMKAIKLLRE